MKVHLQFFSHLRELAGISEMDLELQPNAKVSDLLSDLYSRIPALQQWDQSILIAAGVEFVGRDYVLRQSDQISVMPPVQGG